MVNNMLEIMPASEARKLAGIGIDDHIGEIEQIIRDAAKSGKREVIIEDKPTSPLASLILLSDGELLTVLKRGGYEVLRMPGMSSCVRIRW